MSPPASSASARTQSWPCRWDYCRLEFLSEYLLIEHVEREHVATAVPIKRSQLHAVLHAEGEASLGVRGQEELDTQAFGGLAGLNTSGESSALPNPPYSPPAPPIPAQLSDDDAACASASASAGSATQTPTQTQWVFNAPAEPPSPPPVPSPSFFEAHPELLQDSPPSQRSAPSSSSNYVTPQEGASRPPSGRSLVPEYPDSQPHLNQHSEALYEEEDLLGGMATQAPPFGGSSGGSGEAAQGEAADRWEVQSQGG